MPFNEGDRVRLKSPTIEGPVSDIVYDKASKELAYHVSWTDEDGHEQERFFPESQLELVEAAPVEEPAADPAPTPAQEG